MQKIFTTLVACLLITQLFAQQQRKVSTCLMAQYNGTLTDAVKGNNPWNIGLGLNTLLNTQSRLKPALELTGDVYLESDKVFWTDSSGNEIPSVGGMVNLLIGPSFDLGPAVYLSLLAGPSFINDKILAGLKPSLGFYFSKSRRWTGKAAYIHIFNRYQREDFTSLSLAVGVRLF